MNANARKLCWAASVLGLPVSAQAAEVVSYTYDPQGRLVKVIYGGSGPSAGLDIVFTYDAAGNRISYRVVGSKNQGQQMIAIPLNGVSLIPVNP